MFPIYSNNKKTMMNNQLKKSFDTAVIISAPWQKSISNFTKKNIKKICKDENNFYLYQMCIVQTVHFMSVNFFHFPFVYYFIIYEFYFRLNIDAHFLTVQKVFKKSFFARKQMSHLQKRVKKLL